MGGLFALKGLSSWHAAALCGAVGAIRGNLPLLDQLVIFDVNGQQVSRLAGSTCELDLSGLAAGTYLIQLEKGAEKVVRKIVKQ